MDNLVSWLADNQAAAKIAITAIIGLVAVIVIGFLLIKAINAARHSKMNDVGKHLGFAAIVVLIAVVGIGGMIALINLLAPDDSILPQDGTDLASVPAQVQYTLTSGGLC